MEAIPDDKRITGEVQSEAIPDEKQRLEGMQPDAIPGEKTTEAIPAGSRLAARLREETAELLALLPAARKAAAGGPAGGEAALDGMARAAYRVLRIAENMEACAALGAGAVQAVPICVTALAAAYVNGAAGVCRTAVFRPEWPREPLWAPGCARFFAAALGNLLANAVQYGGERPAVSVRAQKSGAMLLLTVADNGAGYAAHPAARTIARPGMQPAAPAALRAGHTEAENGLGPAALSEAENGLGPAALSEAENGLGSAALSKTTNDLRAAASPEAADGLGLAVVRQYAAAFGGQLLAGSAPGQGARFTLCLPLCAPDRANLSGAADPPGTRGPTPMQSAANLPGKQETPPAWPAPPIPPDYIADRFSPLYVQLAPVCDLPL